MPFLRVTRDRHGYETTLLLHAVRPGERPRVLYMYRTAPSVAIGRKPLDEEAIRVIEEQHPAVDFDWLGLSESSGPIITEPERRPRKKGKPRGREDEGEFHPPLDPQAEAQPDEQMPVVMHAAEHAVLAADAERRREAAQEARAASGLLDQLVGREIATRLRQRHAELVAAVAARPELDDVDTLRARIASIDPDGWATPFQILEGIQRAEGEYEELSDELGRR